MERNDTSLPLTEATDEIRVVAGRSVDESKRSQLGQFMTPAPTARLMASMFELPMREIRVLDAGAGVGSLTAALVEALAARRDRPTSIDATLFEIDPPLLPFLRATSRACRTVARDRNMNFIAHVRDEDFIHAATAEVGKGLFGTKSAPRFHAAILNPPYRKLSSLSRERVMLREAGIETSNLYAAFVALAVKLLEPGGELVAITPRSFCNGPYFRRFREFLFTETTLRRVHVFEARDRAFADDGVLQENVIIHAVKGAQRNRVVLSSSTGPSAPITAREVPHESVVDPSDPHSFVHLAVSESDERVARWMRSLPACLLDLGVEVSTGRVVDFRSREHLQANSSPQSVPLVYPAHFRNGFVSWPIVGGRKPNALADHRDTRELMLPSETFVLTKRFTSKEERRRVVAAVYEPSRLPPGVLRVGFENHLNYFHVGGRGLPKTFAKGLALYLNCTRVDAYFRQFNGHTQVNASDLRSLRYPTATQLTAMGRRFGQGLGEQSRIDSIVDEFIGHVRNDSAL